MQHEHVPQRAPALLALILIATSGCAAHSSADERDERDPTAKPAATATTLADFDEGRWTFRPDRQWKPTSSRVQSPSDAKFSDEDYDAVSQTEQTVLVSANASSVAIGVEPMTGSRSRTSTETQLSYDLSQGTFAGGRFLVWQDGDGLQAELTIFGSGLPIVESKRGALVRNE